VATLSFPHPAAQRQAAKAAFGPGRDHATHPGGMIAVLRAWQQRPRLSGDGLSVPQPQRLVAGPKAQCAAGSPVLEPVIWKGPSRLPPRPVMSRCAAH